MTDKVRENRLRRMAHRQGYILVKSRLRDPRAIGFGLYNVIPDSAGNRLASAEARASWRCDMTIDEVERWLTK